MSEQNDLLSYGVNKSFETAKFVGVVEKGRAAALAGNADVFETALKSFHDTAFIAGGFVAVTEVYRQLGKAPPSFNEARTIQ